MSHDRVSDSAGKRVRVGRSHHAATRPSSVGSAARPAHLLPPQVQQQRPRNSWWDSLLKAGVWSPFFISRNWRIGRQGESRDGRVTARRRGHSLKHQGEQRLEEKLSSLQDPPFTTSPHHTCHTAHTTDTHIAHYTHTTFHIYTHHIHDIPHITNTPHTPHITHPVHISHPVGKLPLLSTLDIYFPSRWWAGDPDALWREAHPHQNEMEQYW